MFCTKRNKWEEPRPLVVVKHPVSVPFASVPAYPDTDLRAQPGGVLQLQHLHLHPQVKTPHRFFYLPVKMESLSPSGGWIIALWRILSPNPENCWCTVRMDHTGDQFKDLRIRRQSRWVQCCYQGPHRTCSELETRKRIGTEVGSVHFEVRPKGPQVKAYRQPLEAERRREQILFLF